MALNLFLMVLAFTPMYLLFLSILVTDNPYSALSIFNCCMHLPTFEMPTIRQIWPPLFNKAIMLFLLIKDAYVYIPTASIIIILYGLFGNISLISGRFCHFRWLWFLPFSCHSLNPYCSFADARNFCVIIYLDDILVLTLSMLARQLKPFCTLYWFILDYTY